MSFYGACFGDLDRPLVRMRGVDGRHICRQAPASTGLLGELFGDDAGVPIQPYARAVHGTKPLSRDQARGMLGAAMKVIDAARKLGASLPGVTTREQLAKQLGDVYAGVQFFDDPIPEELARPIRELVMRAVVEFNAVAEGHETLRRARAQLLTDLEQNAKAVAGGIGDALMLALAAAAAVAAYVVLS